MELRSTLLNAPSQALGSSSRENALLKRSPRAGSFVQDIQKICCYPAALLDKNPHSPGVLPQEAKLTLNSYLKAARLVFGSGKKPSVIKGQGHGVEAINIVSARLIQSCSAFVARTSGFRRQVKRNPSGQ